MNKYLELELDGVLYCGTIDYWFTADTLVYVNNNTITHKLNVLYHKTLIQETRK